MNQQINQAVYYRLIALWVLCEAMLGGIIHAMKIPVSGLIVGSAAVICICLIAYYVPAKGAIIKATIIVCIFKMLLSPQTPVLAYAAVFFQGIMGEVLFFNRKLYRLSCVLLGILALLESGLQRIIVLTIVYGNDFWKVLNDFINGLTKQKTFTNYSLLVAISYVSLHIIVGIMAGWWAGVIPKKIIKWRAGVAISTANTREEKFVLKNPKRKKRRIKKLVFIIWLILVLLYLKSYFKIGGPLRPPNTPLQIFIRSAIIILGWYFVVGPLLGLFVRYWLSKKQSASTKEIESILALLPSVKEIIRKSWTEAHNKKGLNKIIFFCKLVIAHVLVMPGNKKVFILTGQIHSGKTTSILQWSERRVDMGGILTPLEEGKRYFFDMAAKEQFAMEAAENEEGFVVGKYKFSKQAFHKAISKIQENSYKPWIVIDEIGPLELKGEGFAKILKEILQTPTEQKILLVVRESILSEVIQNFPLQDAVIIRKISDTGE